MRNPSIVPASRASRGVPCCHGGCLKLFIIDAIILEPLSKGQVLDGAERIGGNGQPLQRLGGSQDIHAVDDLGIRGP